MYEDAQEIFEYLPINKNSVEEEYVNHLWNALVSLDSGDQEGISFLIMPFHLLFMLGIQYKILRIFKYKKERYQSAFLLYPLRDGEKELLNPESVFTMGFLEESKMVNMLKIVNVSDSIVGSIKSLIKNRNENLAHAKGGIERNLEDRVFEYINIMKQIQPYFEEINDEVAEKWLKEMGTGQDGVDYIELHTAEEYLCNADMWTGKLSTLEKKLNNDL